MGLALQLARWNVEHHGGGPFGAAVFEEDTGLLVSPGINLVLASGYSFAHAEMVALSLAQAVLGTHDLGTPGLPRLQLVSTAEPCAMCLGAIPWSGVHSLICGARDEDVRSIGFDEGTKPVEGVGSLRRRGIEVLRDVRREEAKRILRTYRDSGGRIYNGRGGAPECG